MTEVLSSKEIDELITAINAGDTEPEGLQPDVNTRKIRIYDFKRPIKFSGEQLRTVEIMHETFARLSATSLSAQLRSMVSVKVVKTFQLTYDEFIRSIPTPTTLAIINMDPLKGNAILEIEPAITFSIIDRLAGGTGEGCKFQHELTDIETSLMEGIIVRMLGNLREAWCPVIDLRPRLGQIDTNPVFAQIATPTDMVIFVSFEVKIGDVEGMMNLCIPYLTIEPIDKKLTFSFLRSKPARGPILEGVKILKSAFSVKLTAEVLRRVYSIREISGWKEGTILKPSRPLTSDRCFLEMGKKHMWKCEILKDAEEPFRQIKIIEHVKESFEMEDTKMSARNMTGLLEAGITISAEIGSTIMRVKDAMGIGEGTIIELDKLITEPVLVKANGVPFGTAEVICIDDNNFGIRITEIITESELDEEPDKELEGN